VVHQEGDILETIPERREVDGEAAKAIVEIFAQLAHLDHPPWVLVRRRQESRRNAARRGRAQRTHLPGVDHAQELRLMTRAQRLELVEEKHAAVGALQEAGVVAIRAGEGAPAYRKAARLSGSA